MSPFEYRAYGLNIASDLELPQLAEIPPGIVPDVTVKRDVAGVIPIEALGGNRFVAGVHGEDYILLWKKFGSFLVREGAEILYTPPHDDEDAVIAPLLGVVLGTLLHQRHVFTLHASAINYHGSAVAFVAHKGTGKSTTCANMYNRGYSLVTDDVLAVRLDDAGAFNVEPAFPTMKLNPDAIELIGEEPQELDRIVQAYEKRYFSASDRFTQNSLPLSTIYVLENGNDFSVQELEQKDAFIQMLEHSYVVRFFGRLAAGKEHFQDCERIVKNVRIKRLVRPRDLSRMEEYLDFIEADLAASHMPEATASA